MAIQDTVGIGLSAIAGTMADFGILYEHSGLSVPMHGSPIYLKTNNYEDGVYDLRPVLMLWWTDDTVAPYTWNIASGLGGHSLTVTNSANDVLSVTPVYVSGFLGALRFDGIRTGRAEITITLLNVGTPVYTTGAIVVNVVGDSLFTDEQLAAFGAGAKARQKWSIRLNDTREDLVVIHDETDHAALRAVTSKGTRRNKAINISPSKNHRLSSSAYSITCSNASGRFSTEAADSFFTGDYGSYEINECNLIHQVYLWVGGEWEELEFMTYEGKISNLRFSDENADVDIETEELSGLFAMRTIFDETHGDHDDTTLVYNTELT